MKSETSTGIQKEKGEGDWFDSGPNHTDIGVVVPCPCVTQDKTEQNNAKGRLGAMHILMAFPLCPNLKHYLT